MPKKIQRIRKAKRRQKDVTALREDTPPCGRARVSGDVVFPRRLRQTMTAKLNYFPPSEVEASQSLDEALRTALQKWQLETGHTLQYWLRGYCASFASVLVKFMGKSARLGSVLANDGNVHHIVVILGNLMIDARGVNTEQSLLSEINHEARTNDHSLRAIRVIPFELEHTHFLRECHENQLRKLRACFNTQIVRRIRRRFKTSISGCIQARRKDKNARFARGESCLPVLRSARELV